MIQITKCFFGNNNRWIYSLSIAIFSMILLTFGIIQIKQDEQLVKHGVVRSDLRRKITYQLFDSVSYALERYKYSNGQYPQIHGKYFFDSIKSYVGIIEVYVFADSIKLTDTLIMGWGTTQRYNYKTTRNTYLGISSPEQYIKYKPVGDKYIIYSIGENWIDENGGGDDILYQKKNQSELMK